MPTRALSEIGVVEVFVAYFLVSILISVAIEGINKVQKRHFGDRIRDIAIFFCMLLLLVVAYLYILGPDLREIAATKFS